MQESERVTRTRRSIGAGLMMNTIIETNFVALHPLVGELYLGPGLACSFSGHKC
jgi:hypothetical protein